MELVYFVPIPDLVEASSPQNRDPYRNIDIQMLDKRHNYAAAGHVASNNNRRLKIIEARRAGASLQPLDLVRSDPALPSGLLCWLPAPPAP